MRTFNSHYLTINQVYLN